MTHDLQVPGDVLEEAGASLGRLKSEFDNADDNADQAADAVGEPKLAGAVEDFAGNWDKSRSEIVESIGKLDEIAKACAQAFEEIEQHFVQALADAQSQGGAQAQRDAR